ncbi:MAG TPA: RNA polymerase sigma factor [bacterium]|nr:RNA polymerase sigma factor [bacterium]
MEDRELVEKLLAKDEKAYRIFYETYRDKLYKACVYLLGYQDPDAEDITHEVFLAALRQLPQFEFRSSLYHWLYRICMYLCYERIRKRRRVISSLDEELEAAVDQRAFAAQDRELEEEKEKQKMLDLLESQRELMGDPCRSLLDLREKEKKSYAQLADLLKVPIGTVMSRLSRCKEALKALILKAMKEAAHGG